MRFGSLSRALRLSLAQFGKDSCREARIRVMTGLRTSSRARSIGSVGPYSRRKAAAAAGLRDTVTLRISL